ncbi:rhoptry neck protein [Cyclospora cayetanensis]|uniref:Rhoptry neck protein n=1 Tax=Cyclospora cayetanensis TaxID=88456 RepID=A0A1D3D1G9_9EIME|nr:rhoptry neck protein [Cyclospora cayetanensis]
MITLLFQLYAINIEDITKRGKRVSHALSAGNASWNYADGLWIGAFDFGRAFINVIQTYLRRAESFVDYCSNKNAESQKFAETASMTDTQTISAESLEEPEASGQFAEPLVDEDLLKAFEAIAPESDVRDIDVSKRVNVACQKYKKFVSSFSRNRLSHVERFVIQTIKVLKYDYKFFQRYIGEMMSIFYEMAYGLLNADVANVLSDKMSLDTMRERIHTALAKFQVYREVSSEIQSSSLPRTLFREPWFTRSARDLAHGFFESGANNLHKSVNSLFREFLTARLMIARLEGHSSVKTIQDFIALCNPQLGIPDINLCGKVVTSEVDPAAFVKEALFALHAPMTTSADDIAFHNDSKLGNVFTSWSGTGLSEQNRAVAEGASDRAAMENFILHLREAVQSRLTFSRFEFADNFTRLVLHDTNGRSVNFIPDNEDDVKALAGQKTTPQRSSRPSPLDTNCWFSVTEANKGTLKFVTMDAKELETSIEGLAVPAEGIPTYEIPGQVMYRDRREELRSIINEPSAVRDVIVAKFVDQSGRAAAEMMANLLYILHSRTPSFSSHSPSVFLQNIMPKMFFDSFQALSVASKSRKSASVVLEGRLYSFALSFDNLKSIFLGAVNRLILRMHSLDSRDMVSVFMMTVAVMAYQRVQKHRTGKTLVMNMFLRDVLHLQRANQLGRLLEEAPHCAWLEKQEGLPQEEFVIKCAALRFLKIGSLKIEDAEVVNVRNYLAEFFNILNGLRGKTRWMDFLNIRTFSAEADLYAETAAQYSYEKLEGQLRDEETHEQIGEYGQLQLAFEELALILSDARSMQNVISELRSIPVQTVEAKEEYDKLKARVDELPPETVETATGWSLRYMNDGKGGLEIAIGLLALKSGNEGQLNKALHLSLANVEVLRFLNSALDVAQVLEYLPSATPEELQKLRLSLGEFKATVHAEPQTTALNTKAQYSVRQGVDNLSNEETLSTHCRNLLKPPHILADESLCSKTVDDWVILCFILIKLEKRGPIPEEIAPMELVKAAFVDGKSVESHLHDLVNSGLPSDFRLQVANSINPFLRGLLIFFMGHQLGDVGAAQLLSVDLPTGVISFSFTHVYEFTSAEPEHGGTPAYVFRKLARIAFGAESLEESKPIKIANTSISYPQSLDDWYAFVDLEKLEALTSQKIKADALAEISAWSRFMDLVDFFFAMRQSSLIAPQTMVASASDALLKDDSITFLERVGMIVFISDFHKLAETAKIDCLQDAMKNIVTYVPLQIREKHLYKYDCFETKLSEDMAASNAAKTATDEFVARAIEAIEAAYIVKAKELFNKVMSKPDQSELAIKRAMQFSQHVPVSEFGGKVAKEIVEIVFRHGTWDNLLAGLQRLRDIEWQFHTPLRKRVINEKTRPKFFNPIILATDCLSFMLAESVERQDQSGEDALHPDAQIFEDSGSDEAGRLQEVPQSLTMQGVPSDKGGGLSSSDENQNKSAPSMEDALSKYPPKSTVDTDGRDEVFPTLPDS